MTVSNDELASNINSLSMMYQLEAILIQLEKNLALISQGATGQIINVNGGSLFQLASKYYGDATAWTTIAQANGLTDPEIPAGAMQIVIPLQATNTGGVLQN